MDLLNGFILDKIIGNYKQAELPLMHQHLKDVKNMIDEFKNYYEQCIDLLNASIEGRMYFDTYSMYDLIVNYKKRFKF